MTTLVRQIRSYSAVAPHIDAAQWQRFSVVVAFAALALASGQVERVAHAMADAYLQVTVFVAATLMVIAAVQRAMRGDLGVWLDRHQRWQVPTGALLGALPGCGGAIVAVTQFTRGSLSFGGVVATLTSTMGDAMFLLLAREPATAGAVLMIGIVAAVITGYTVDAIHGARFLQPARAAVAEIGTRPWFDARLPVGEQAWWAVMVPGLALGVAGALQIEVEPQIALGVGVAGAAIALALWVARGDESRDCQDGVCGLVSESRSAIDSSNFINAWVVFAFVAYELAIAASGWDIASALNGWGPALPAAAIAIGFIPGCGPQIVVSSLYLDGALPLSAQLGNAISNDGDALFPAIVRAPGAAALATVYTTVPAAAVAYGAYALGW